MLKILGIGRSGYYDFLKRKPSKQLINKQKISIRIKEVYYKYKGIYGAPKISLILNRNGWKVSQKHVGNIMRENGLKARYIKPYTVTTISEDFSAALKNLLDREFNPTKPNAAWCSDITYIWTIDDGFVYLTSVMDLYSRKIIAWTLSKDMEAKTVLECLRQAKEERPSIDPIVIQSDRGVQYTSEVYQKLTTDMKASYSRKATPWDNACIESYHALLKREWLNHERIQNYEQAYKLVFHYIEGFYNSVRIHSHCEYMSPNDYEKKYYQELKS